MSRETLEQDARRFGLTAGDVSELALAAIQAKQFAYCRYSNFRVGCALLTDTGKRLTGANVENAAYPVGICAERCAMAKAVADGHRKFIAIAVATDTPRHSSPCGMCRQFMREFCDLQTPIFMLGQQGGEVEKDSATIITNLKTVGPQYAVMTMNDLLPDSFGPESLPLLSQSN